MLTGMLRAAGIHPLSLRLLDALQPVSLALLCLFAFTIALSNTVSNAALIAIILGTLPAILASPRLRRNPVVVMSALWCAFVVVVALRAALEGFPGHPLRSIGKDFLLAISPVIGVQLAVLDARMRVSPPLVWAAVLGCASLGTALLLLKGADWRAGLDLFAVYAQGSGAFNRNYGAFLSGMAMLASLTLAVWACERARLARSWRAALLAGSALLFLLFGFALFALQSRSSWIATALGLLAWMLTFVLAGLRRRRNGALLWTSAVVGVLIAAAVSLAALRAPAIEKRLGEAGGIALNFQAAKDLALGRTAEVKAVAERIDPRFQLYLVASALIGQKPWLGWGPDVTSLIPAFSPFEEVRTYTQFHNGYLQFVVSLGFVGVALQLLLAGTILRESWRGRPRAGPAAPEENAALRAAFASLLVYNLVVNVTESNFFLNAGAMAVILLGAALCLSGSVGADTRATIRDLQRTGS